MGVPRSNQIEHNIPIMPAPNPGSVPCSFSFSTTLWMFSHDGQIIFLKNNTLFMSVLNGFLQYWHSQSNNTFFIFFYHRNYYNTFHTILIARHIRKALNDSSSSA